MMYIDDHYDALGQIKEHVKCKAHLLIITLIVQTLLDSRLTL